MFWNAKDVFYIQEVHVSYLADIYGQNWDPSYGISNSWKKIEKLINSLIEQG